MTSFAAQRELRENIKTALDDRMRKRRELAEHLGLPVSHLANRLHGQWWSRDEVERTAEFLQMSAGELIGGSFFRGPEWNEELRRRRSQPTRSEIRKGASPIGDRASGDDANVTTAICCECGALRKTGAGFARLELRDDDDIRGRMTRKLRCESCRASTRHAVLRIDEYAENAELKMYRLTREQAARRDLDKLIGRLRGFGVEVSEWSVNRRRTERWMKRGADLLRVEFDTSKSQWRFDLHPGVPALILLPALQKIWKCVAVDGVDSDEWEDYDIYSGISYSPSASNFEKAVDDLIADLMQDENAIRRSIIDRAQQSDSRARFDAEGSA